MVGTCKDGEKGNLLHLTQLNSKTAEPARNGIHWNHIHIWDERSWRHPQLTIKLAQISNMDSETEGSFASEAIRWMTWTIFDC